MLSGPGDLLQFRFDSSFCISGAVNSIILSVWQHSLGGKTGIWVFVQIHHPPIHDTAAPLDVHDCYGAVANFFNRRGILLGIINNK